MIFEITITVPAYSQTMSKTTAFLLIIFFIFVGLLAFTIYGFRENPIITSITQSLQRKLMPAETSLFLSTESQTLQPGQTATIAILIHSINPHPNIAEIELAYDPAALTVDSVTPGPFFTKPTTALQTIDQVAGRISYALRCPNTQNSNTITQCDNPSSKTLATITVSVNQYATQNTTKLTFLPRTVIRIKDGRDVLKNATGLNLTIGSTYASTPGTIRFPLTTGIKATPAPLLPN